MEEKFRGHIRQLLRQFPAKILGLLSTHFRSEDRKNKNKTLVIFKNLVLVSGLDEYSRRPEGYVLSTGKQSPTFRRGALPSSSFLFDCLTNKTKALRPSGTSVGIEYSVLCNIPEERFSQYQSYVYFFRRVLLCSAAT